MAGDPNSAVRAPELLVTRLLYAICGSVQAAKAPSWLLWLRSAYPDLAVRVVVTRSALCFVTGEALATLGNCAVDLDGRALGRNRLPMREPSSPLSGEAPGRAPGQRHDRAPAASAGPEGCSRWKEVAAPSLFEFRDLPDEGPIRLHRQPEPMAPENSAAGKVWR